MDNNSQDPKSQSQYLNRIELAFFSENYKTLIPKIIFDENDENEFVIAKIPTSSQKVELRANL